MSRIKRFKNKYVRMLFGQSSKGALVYLWEYIVKNVKKDSKLESMYKRVVIINEEGY